MFVAAIDYYMKSVFDFHRRSNFTSLVNYNIMQDCCAQWTMDGNSDDSALTELTPDGFLNEVIIFQVHSSCGFIQH